MTGSAFTALNAAFMSRTWLMPHARCMIRSLFATSVATLLALSVPAIAQPAEAWEIGPTIRGRNYSIGMPATLEPARGGSSFEFPTAGAGSVHYVTASTGPLEGASRIVMRYRIDAARGARFIAQENPEQPATVSLFFQRQGDSWSGKRHEFHRWYSPDQTMRRVAPGEYEIAVSLRDPNWVSVFGKPASVNPKAFAMAMAETSRIGFVFGSEWGRGHGVFATAPARFALLSFRVI